MADRPGNVLNVVRFIKDKHSASDVDLPRRTYERIHQVAAHKQLSSADHQGSVRDNFLQACTSGHSHAHQRQFTNKEVRI